MVRANFLFLFHGGTFFIFPLVDSRCLFRHRELTDQYRENGAGVGDRVWGMYSKLGHKNEGLGFGVRG